VESLDLRVWILNIFLFPLVVDDNSTDCNGDEDHETGNSQDDVNLLITNILRGSLGVVWLINRLGGFRRDIVVLDSILAL